MTRILLDGRLLARPHSGVGAVAKAIASALVELVHQGSVELLVVTDEANKASDPGVGVQVIRSQLPFMHAALPAAARKTGSDMILVPRQTGPLASFVPFSCVFHDIGFIAMPTVYGQPKSTVQTTRWASWRSDSILCVSEFTQLEVASHLGRTRNVRNLSLGAMRSVIWDPSEVDPFVLCIGAMQPNKNLVRLVDAWKSARLDLRLEIVAGEGAAADSVRSAIHKAQATGHRISLRQGLPDRDLEALMASCWAYVQPSLYEGLCIPALDMLANSIPCVTSSTANLGRVLSGVEGAVFDPHSSREMANALERVVTDTGFRSVLSRQGAAAVDMTRPEIISGEIKEALGL